MPKVSDKIHVGSKIKKYGEVVTVEKFGFAGKEVVYGLSDGTMIFKNDLDCGDGEIELVEEVTNN
jgi:hypothetical protein